MLLKIISGGAKWLKSHISGYRIQNRLFISAVVLFAVVITSLYFLSHSLVSGLIVQRQADYELDSFKQVNNFLQSVFSSSEGYIETLYKDPQVRDVLTNTQYDRNDAMMIAGYVMGAETSLNNILINKDFMDNVILLGKNNFACAYKQKEPVDTSFIGSDFDFQGFLKESFLAPHLDNNSYPFYYVPNSGHTPRSDTEKRITAIINGKIMMIRQLKDEMGRIEGVIIVTFRDRIIPSIIPTASYNRTLYLTDNKGVVVWKSNSGKGLPGISPDNYFPAGNGGSHIKSLDGEDYLVTDRVLEPYDFKITSLTPVNSFLKEDRPIGIYALIFGLCCFFLTFMSSYFFSRNTCKQLDALTRQLADRTYGLPRKVALASRGSLYGRLSLRTKIFIHFGISVIIPTILFISFITYLNYGSYKKKTIEFSSNSVKQLKWNIDYKISGYNKLSIQTVFDSNIQSSFDAKNYENNDYEIKLKISEAFLNRKIKNRDILSLNLYDREGKKIYSNIPFDNSPATDISPDFFKMMENSSNNLVYLGAREDYLGIGPVLLFARNVNSLGTGFGRLQGYLVFSIDQKAIQGITKKVKLGDTSLLFLMDDEGKIVPDNTMDSTLKELEPDLNLLAFSGRSEGALTLLSNGRKYFVFFNTLSIPRIKVIGIVSREEMISRVLPVIWYSLFLLAACLLVIVLISAFIAWGITKPLKRLELLMNEIRNENFQVGMSYKGKDEIAILSENFNRMVDRLNQLIYENYQSKLHASELMFLEKEAQFNALQQQINPHFLYNTLESIKWMAYKIDAVDICNMTTALGKFFRGTITKGKDFITLQQEIELLESYIYIQKIRYQGKLDVVWDISEEIKEYKMIKLTLQPIVENAIIHGIEKIKSGGVISIKGCLTDGTVCLEVADTGAGMSRERLSELKEKILSLSPTDSENASIGLSNVYKRLKLYFEDESSFEISSREGEGTVVKISFPVILEFPQQ